MFLREIFKEVYCSALVKLLSWVLQHSEYDGLRRGTDQSEDPGTRNHQPSVLTEILLVIDINYILRVLKGDLENLKFFYH